MADDLTRWLRRVRPPTRADEDWAAGPEGSDMLTSIHLRARRPARPRMRPRIWLPAAAVAMACAVLVVVTSLGTSPGRTAPQAGSNPATPRVSQHLPTMRPAAMILQPYASCDDLLRGLRAHTAAHVQPYGLPGTGSAYSSETNLGADNVSVPQPSAAAATTGGTSTTNVQEIGVDEPDIVKTDGDRVVTITDGVLHVLDARTRSVVGTLDLTMYDGWQSAQLLVSGDHAAVVLGGAGNYSGVYGGIYDGPAVLTGSPAPTKSTVLYVDLAGTPAVTGSLRATGRYLDARMVGSTIRLVVSSAPAIVFGNPTGSSAHQLAHNKAIVAKAPLSAWLPSYTVSSGASTVSSAVPCEQVSHPADYTGTSMLTIYTLDLAHLGADPEPVSVAADGDTVYATGTSLYIASNESWSCCLPAAAPAQPTQIHRFDISGSARPTYLGSGSVPGRLLSQYSLSDYQGHLRVATTSGSANSVYVLDADTLKTTGHVDGLGRGEQLYAVRFLGPLAYLVTFQQTDPLYVLDLSNPAAPRAIGSLQLTGYSDYLHDAGNGRLLGVGQEADSVGRVAGLQVSLFDVRAGSTPTRTGHVVLPQALDERTLDPHAFLYWAPTGLVVVPVQSWSGTESGQVLVLRVDGPRLVKVGLVANPLGGTSDDGLGVQRSLLVDGALWTVSGDGVQVSDPSSLARQAWVPFA